MKYIIAYFLFLFSLQSFGQVNEADSILSNWKDNLQDDTTRLNELFDLTLEDYVHTHPDSAIVLARHQLELAERGGFEKHIGKAFFLEGLAHRMKGDSIEAEEFLKKSLNKFKSLNSKLLIADNLRHLGNLKQDFLDYDSSHYYYDESIELYNSLDLKAKVASVFLKKSYSALNGADYSTAMKYSFEALRIYEELEDEWGRAEAHVSLCEILYYQENYRESINYGKKSLEIFKKLDDQQGVADAHREIGESYLILEEYDSALVFINIALDIRKSIGDSQLIIASVTNSRGNIYKFMEDYDRALADYSTSLKICEELNFEPGIVPTRANIGHVYILKGEYEMALPYTLESIEKMEASENRRNLIENYFHASTAYEGIGNYKDALSYYQKYSTTKDTIFTEEKDRNLTELRTEYETEKKEEEIIRLEKEAELEEKARLRDRQIRILLAVLAGLLVFLAIGLWNRLSFMRKSKKIIQKEKDRSENLLLNILPAEIAEELKIHGKADARDFDMVSILFTDFKEFTQISEKLNAQELVSEINACFEEFDAICEKHKIEKIKTIGDSYMAAGGIPVPTDHSTLNTVLAGLEMQSFIQKRKKKNEKEGLPAFEMRVGIHTGPVVAGIVGVKKFQYDLWGDTVNTASRMESNSEVGQVNISKGTYDLIKDLENFSFENRGEIEAKGKGAIPMWFVRES